jgi:hypothetical protein
MKISRRGGAEPSLNFAIGMILGVTILLIIGGIVLKFWMASQQTKQSFDLFHEEIMGLSDGDEKKEVLYLNEKYNVVAFGNGGNTCEHNMYKPPSCGEFPCICYCKKGATGTILISDCQERGYCKSLAELDYDPIIQYSGCDYGEGLFTSGEKGGLIELHYKREGDNIYVSEDSDKLYSMEHQEQIEGFQAFVANISACEQDTKNCRCQLNYSFLEEEYRLGFKGINAGLFHKDELLFIIDTNLYFSVALPGTYADFYLTDPYDDYSERTRETDPDDQYVSDFYIVYDKSMEENTAMINGRSYYFQDSELLSEGMSKITKNSEQTSEVPYIWENKLYFPNTVGNPDLNYCGSIVFSTQE